MGIFTKIYLFNIYVQLIFFENLKVKYNIIQFYMIITMNNDEL